MKGLVYDNCEHRESELKEDQRENILEGTNRIMRSSECIKRDEDNDERPDNEEQHEEKRDSRCKSRFECSYNLMMH